jgi:hypothetical protein
MVPAGVEEDGRQVYRLIVNQCCLFVEVELQNSKVDRLGEEQLSFPSLPFNGLADERDDARNKSPNSSRAQNERSNFGHCICTSGH